MSRSVLFLSCVLCAEALRVLCLCSEAGSRDAGCLGTECRVGSGPRSHGPLSLFPLCLPSPNSPWVYVIRPKWAAVCTSAVWFCPAQGTSLPAEKQFLERNKVDEDSFQTTKAILREITHLQKSQPRNLPVFCVLDLLGERRSSWPPRPVWITWHPSKWLFILNQVSLLQKYAKKMIFHHC